MVVKNINEELCIGCKICVDICTEDVIRFDEVEEKAIRQISQGLCGVYLL